MNYLKDSHLLPSQKVNPAERDEISDKMSNLRLQSDHISQNQYYKPFNPNLMDVESSLNRGYDSKKTEFKDTINDRLNHCHNSNLVPNRNPPTQTNINISDKPQHIPIKYQDDRQINHIRTNRIDNRQKNNERLTQYTPLGNNSYFPSTQLNPSNNNNSYNPSHSNTPHSNPHPLPQDTKYNPRGQSMDRMSVNSNQYFDNNGNLLHNCIPTTKTPTLTEENYQTPNHNIMTIGRLPNVNESSRTNFRDKHNQRLQGLMTLPKNSSMPINTIQSQPLNQHIQENLWRQQNQHGVNMKKRINELNQHCQLVVNEMMPIDTSQVRD